MGVNRRVQPRDGAVDHTVHRQRALQAVVIATGKGAIPQLIAFTARCSGPCHQGQLRLTGNIDA
jgi:hypothetical protein